MEPRERERERSVEPSRDKKERERKREQSQFSLLVPLHATCALLLRCALEPTGVNALLEQAITLARARWRSAGILASSDALGALEPHRLVRRVYEIAGTIDNCSKITQTPWITPFMTELAAELSRFASLRSGLRWTLEPSV